MRFLFQALLLIAAGFVVGTAFLAAGLDANIKLPLNPEVSLASWSYVIKLLALAVLAVFALLSTYIFHRLEWRFGFVFPDLFWFFIGVGLVSLFMPQIRTVIGLAS
jgi:hypothetical protein